MPNKQFKTIDEQLEILRSRGLKIEDENSAKEFLLQNNYYRISGYSLTLRKNDVFSKFASFQLLMDIYNFDQELRHILLQFIDIIEVKIKSIYAYEFTKKYSPTEYLKDNHFTAKEEHKRIIEKAMEQKKNRLKHEAYLLHHAAQGINLPLWAFVDLLTMSDISILYSISEPALQDSIAAKFSYKYADILGKHLHSMTIIRNLCAHGSRLFNRIFSQKPSLNKKEKALLIKRNGIIDNAHLYGFIIIMKRLLTEDKFQEFKLYLNYLSCKYPNVRLDYCGFHNDWKQQL